VKLHLLENINLKSHPELVRLLEANETLSDLLKLSSEDLLLRWFNYHLKNANSKKRVNNFNNDIKDSEAYTILLNRIKPDQCDTANLNITDVTQRATNVLSNVKKLGVQPFIKPNDIVQGNSRLNLIFTASIFNTCPGLEPLTVEEKAEIEKAGLMEDDVGDSREERAFRMWINSLGEYLSLCMSLLLI
jgi:plastin-1